MSKIIELNKKETEETKKPNYDAFFEEVVMKCGTVIVDAMKSSGKGDDLLFSCDVGTDKEQHTVSIQISKKQ